MKYIVDLCRGIGGFSRAFETAQGWKIISVDINPKFKPTLIADVTKIDWLEFRKEYLEDKPPEVLLASPPCERFSIACRTWPKIGIKKAMECVGACFEAVGVLKPKYWLIENPMGRLRWFLGKPGITIRQCDYGAPYQKKTDLWGNIPLPMLEATKEAKFWVFPQGNAEKKSRDPKTQNPKPKVNFFIHGTSGSGNGKAKRAEIPLGLSQTILEAVEPRLIACNQRSET